VGHDVSCSNQDCKHELQGTIIKFNKRGHNTQKIQVYPLFLAQASPQKSEWDYLGKKVLRNTTHVDLRVMR